MSISISNLEAGEAGRFAGPKKIYAGSDLSVYTGQYD